MQRLPMIAPQPPKLSAMEDQLRAVEASGVFSNGGPVVRAFEADATARLFGGHGDCLAVNNATIGLMLAIREAMGQRREGYALIPAFTFAATAHAAIWAGLTPILIDSDPDDWAADADGEARAIARHGDRIAVALPYATFGAAIDLDRYRAMHARGIGVVVDAAASLGTRDADGQGFAADAPFASVFSMHATKTFATAEGGLIHCADPARIARLRAMHNFGFDGDRSARMPGLNAKLPEVLGLMAQAKLDEIDAVATHRATLSAAYREGLAGHGFTFQREDAQRQAAQFMPVLLPPALAPMRPAIHAVLDADGIGSANYFSPHLGRQPWFAQNSLVDPTPIADDLAARIVSLPITDAMTAADVAHICERLVAACARVGLEGALARPAAAPVESRVHKCVLIGGGPGGTAMLTAATKRDRLVDLARSGLVVIERDDRLGAGELSKYAITSDSTAETFLSAVKDNVHPNIAALIEHPSGREIGEYVDRLGVPLARTGGFLEATGAQLGRIVTENGGTVLTRTQAVESRRGPSGLWHTRIRDLRDGSERVLLSENIVVATGGYQSREQIAAEVVAGTPIGERAGERLLLSDDFLRLGGVARLADQLAHVRAPRIAIVGASTSALAAAALLLKSQIPFGAGGITLLYRGQLRPFYPSVDAAHEDGFTDFGSDDICPVSGFVYRLAGFRLEARALILRMLGIGGRVPDPRLTLHRISGLDDEAAGRALDDADSVIAALGYRPHGLPLFDAEGNAIPLAAHAPGRPRLADQQCRVIDADGRPIPGAYGIGLAAGFVPEGALGGEKSFRGKANGLWLWQNDVGLMIVEAMLDRAAASQAA